MRRIAQKNDEKAQHSRRKHNCIVTGLRHWIRLPSLLEGVVHLFQVLQIRLEKHLHSTPNHVVLLHLLAVAPPCGKIQAVMVPDGRVKQDTPVRDKGLGVLDIRVPEPIVCNLELAFADCVQQILCVCADHLLRARLLQTKRG